MCAAATLVCHFLLNNRIFVTSKTMAVVLVDMLQEWNHHDRRQERKSVRSFNLKCMMCLTARQLNASWNWQRRCLYSVRLNVLGGADYCLHWIYDASGIRWKTCDYTIYLMLQPVVCNQCLHLDSFTSWDLLWLMACTSTATVWSMTFLSMQVFPGVKGF